MQRACSFIYFLLAFLTQRSYLVWCLWCLLIHRFFGLFLCFTSGDWWLCQMCHRVLCVWRKEFRKQVSNLLQVTNRIRNRAVAAFAYSSLPSGCLNGGCVTPPWTPGALFLILLNSTKSQPSAFFTQLSKAFIWRTKQMWTVKARALTVFYIHCRATSWSVCLWWGVAGDLASQRSNKMRNHEMKMGCGNNSLTACFVLGSTRLD